MRALVEHRGHYGFFRSNPKFTLYLEIEFSNEERAIVTTRALQNYLFDLSPGYLGESESRYSTEALAVMEMGGISLFIAGFLSLFAAAALPVFGLIALFGLFGGVILFWRAQLAKHREQNTYVKQLGLGFLLSHPAISIQTTDPAQAPFLEENIRLRLSKLKHFLSQTHELSTQREFEM